MTALDVVELTQALVAAASPNPPGDERAACAVLAAAVEGLPGVRVRRYGSELRPTVVAAAGSDAPAHSTLLAAHLDTVALGTGWTTDPLGADGVLDGRLFGRGTTDIKGGAAAMAVAFADAVSRGLPSDVRLLLAGNADEEAGGRQGWGVVLREWDERPTAAIVAEPSGIDAPWEALWVGARGSSRFSLRARGVGTHSSLAGRPGAESAFEALEAALAALRALPLCSEDHPRWGSRGRLTVVRVEAGDGWGRVPESATAEVEIRVAPGPTQAEVEDAIHETLATLESPVELAWAPRGLRWIAPSSVAADSELAAVGRSAWRATFGAEPPLRCFPGGTDAYLLQEAGIPALIAGPGALRRAHHPDEYVTVEELHDAVRLYTALLDGLLELR